MMKISNPKFLFIVDHFLDTQKETTKSPERLKRIEDIQSQIRDLILESILCNKVKIAAEMSRLGPEIDKLALDEEEPQLNLPNIK